MKKIIATLIVITFVLSSCVGVKDSEESKKLAALNEQRQEIEKKIAEISKELEGEKYQDLLAKKAELEAELQKVLAEIDPLQAFYIVTQGLSSFSDDIALTKSGILEGSSFIDLSSQASGRVSQIYLSDGDDVKAGQLMIVLADTVASYGIRVQEAQNALQSARINYDQTKLTLDKAVLDAQIAYDQAVADLETARLDAAERLDQAERGLLNVNVEQNIDKAKLELENLERSNEEQIRSYEFTFTTEYNKLNIFLTSIIDGLDQLLDVTGNYVDQNSGFDQNLGVRNTGIKEDTKQAVRDLIVRRDTLRNLQLDGPLDERINILSELYDRAAEVLDLAEQTLIFSIASTAFTQTEIDTERAKIDGFQATYEINSSSLTTFLNASNTFLATYEDEFEAQKKALEILIEDFETREGDTASQVEQTKLQNAKSILAAETLRDNAANALNLAKRNLEVTLQQQQNSIRSAQIRLQDTQTEAGKLTIESPISGVVGTINVDVGEEISPGKVVAKVSSQNTQFTINVTQSIAQNLTTGQKIEVVYRGDVYSATIVSVSSIADQGLNFAVKAQMDGEVDFIGDFVTARIPITAEYPILPIKHVDIVSQGQGQIWIYEDKQAVLKSVELGNVWGDVVEIVSPLPEGVQIITTDMNNYNEKDFQILLKPENTQEEGPQEGEYVDKLELSENE